MNDELTLALNQPDDSAWDEWELALYHGGIDSEWNIGRKNNAIALGLNPWELALMDAIYFGYGQVEDEKGFIEMGHGNAARRSPEKSMAGLKSCFDKGYIHYLTKEFISQKRAEIESGGYELVEGLTGLSNTNDAELIGLMGFTEKGADIFKRWIYTGNEERAKSSWASKSIDRIRSVLYVTDLDVYAEVSKFEPCRRVIKSKKIGRWASTWWHRYESGYKLKLIGKH